MQRLRCHPHQVHDLEELLVARLHQLVHVVAALSDERVVVGEQVGPLEDAVELQLGLVARLGGHGDCNKKEEGEVIRGQTLIFCMANIFVLC